jgi:signal transduction histidine kinase
VDETSGTKPVATAEAAPPYPVDGGALTTRVSPAAMTLDHVRGSSFGLPARLLLLTGLFVLLAEILIFVPSVANFRVNWMVDRLTAAHLASLAAEAVPDGNIPPMLQADLLRTAQVTTVAIRRTGQRRMVLAPDKSVGIDATYDLRTMPRGWFGGLKHQVSLITDALTAFGTAESRVVRVIGHPRAAPAMIPPAPPSPLDFSPDDFIEIVIGEAPLKRAMVAFGLNIAGLSIIISGISAALVYLALNHLLVSPMMRITRNMVHFSQNPEDASRIINPSDRGDEIGTAERELAHMQGELVHLLRQKSRLAQLGLAVSKINHDLRNILASAQLMSDRIVQSSERQFAEGPSADAVNRRFHPKLIASLDRAIKLCNNTLQYGRAEEAAPLRERVALRPMADAVGDGLGLPRQQGDGTTIGWQVDVTDDLSVHADPEHLYRILNNLARNAVQAIDSIRHEGGGPHDGLICITAVRARGGVEITVADNGPGVPERAKATLFQAFQSTNRQGGSGLGLAIAAELVAAHGGRLTLVESKTAALSGANFRFTLPDHAA